MSLLSNLSMVVYKLRVLCTLLRVSIKVNNFVFELKCGTQFLWKKCANCEFLYTFTRGCCMILNIRIKYEHFTHMLALNSKVQTV